MKRILCFFVVVLAVTLPTSVFAEQLDEKLLKEFLLRSSRNVIVSAVDKLYTCERITEIKKDKLGRIEMKVEVITFTGPHNPPYDLVTLTLTNDITGTRVINLTRIKNISSDEVRKHCVQYMDATRQ